MQTGALKPIYTELSCLWHNLIGNESMAASWPLYMPRELHLSQRVTQGCPYKIACPSVRGPLRLRLKDSSYRP